MNATIKYFIKRIAIYLLTLWLAISFSFFIFRLIPGNPVYAFIAVISQSGHTQGEVFEQLVDAYLEKFGLKADLWTQYINFWKRLIFEGDLGPSFINFPNPSMELILMRLPWTIGLLGVATLISWVLGSIFGALIGWRQDSKIDKAFTSIALILSPIPYYLLAIFLVLLVFYATGTIAYGAFSSRLTKELSIEFILSVIKHGSLPAISIVIASLPGWMISMRSLMIPILGEDYLLFAEAKGLKKRRIFMRYAFRNTILPQVTSLGISLGSAMSGSLLVENIFNYPGIGKLFSTALSHLDYNTIMGCLIIIIFSVLTANLLVDLLVPLIDPRVRYSG
jgi:peptide/nickel transport system permease protein